MSRRTVQRAVSEGGIASKVQVAYKLAQAKGFTASSDGTSHRKINYEARHVNLIAPCYSDPSAPAAHQTRLVGVNQALDHTSETQFAGWQASVNEMSMLLDEAPFAMKEKVTLQPDDFARKLKGMHGDHASDQLKTARAMQAWKTAVVQKDLGLVWMVSMPVEELDRRTSEAIDAEMDACGGQDGWSSLDNMDRLERVNSALSGLAMVLGTEVMAELPPEEECALLFFLPILLANKANAATLELSAATDAVAVLAADVSARGGVKLTSLAGAIFNNKDDKKGDQDIHRWHFEQVKRRLENKKCAVKFPSTSNMCFQSHCDGAGELVTYCSDYVAFLEDIRDNKEKHNFNHIELNVYNALHDIPTITELAVLVLYAQLITHPYMRLVRGPGIESVNLLDLGPLHQDLRTHIRKIIANPDVILDSLGLEEEHWKTATLNQKPWMDPKAIEAVASLKPDLPHLKTMLVAFMRGALETWERFSAEFTPGSLIDTASDAERDLAYMPSTNDSNEDAKFGEDDHRFVMLKAREVDASKAPAKFRAKLMARQHVMANGKRKQDEARASKKTELHQKLTQTMLVLDKTAILKLSIKQLDLQLEVYHVLKHDKDVPIKACLKNKATKIDALLAAVSRLKSPSTESSSILPEISSHAECKGEEHLMNQDDDEEVLYYQK
ncbi:hypothetical protein EWM64_g903 [Hericium alpestre]|uniref:Uncharacterized protein n=1 Tax=Hericium alpestre TaxID=135208 RepID=A0A4Z0AAU9_9AGAM|nr:hypothetical protein EWM64_g903 [Hericium alpestre]